MLTLVVLLSCFVNNFFSLYCAHLWVCFLIQSIDIHVGLNHGPLMVRLNNSHNRLKFNRPPSYPVNTIISYKERSKFNISIVFFLEKVNCEKCKKRTIWNRYWKEMLNKCAVFSCTTCNNSQRKDEDAAKLSTFYCPKNKPNLFQAWMKFVNRKDWKPSFCSRSMLKTFHRSRDYKRL